MIELYIVSFAAGILTVLAPCILPLLPIVIGGSSLSSNQNSGSLRQPVTIIISLVVSIILFTLLLKSTTLLIGVPVAVWSIISGGIILLFGINLLFPQLWEYVMEKTGLAVTSQRILGKTQLQRGTKKDILLGAALGPVFNSCSPTYALVVAVILPVSFASGLGYLVAYSVGLGLVLFLISLFGGVIVNKLRWASNPTGAFQKTIGGIFIIVGLIVMVGADKQIQTFVLDRGFYDPIMQLEKSLAPQ